MKIKATYEHRRYQTTEVEVDDDAFLEYVNGQAEYANGQAFDTIDEIRDDDREDFEYLMTEYLQETFGSDPQLLLNLPQQEAGPPECIVHDVKTVW